MVNLTNKTNWTNLTNSSSKKGGYQSLLVYQLGLVIFDFNFDFCSRFLPGKENFRTSDQMTQAARSGKQNVVEGSLEKSLEANIKLTGFGRGSFGELLEDFKDFLRVRKLPVWDKNDQRVLKIRARIRQIGQIRPIRPMDFSDFTKSPEDFANLMVTLLSIENYLLDRLLSSLQEKFVKEGGFRENLFKKRMEFRKKNSSN